MTIEQLQYFYAIHQYRTFSHAALELHITQSSLSKQIAKLEEELGIQLFDRSHRQIALTPVGEQFLQDVDIILNQYEVMISNIKTIKKATSQTLKIAMLPIFAHYDFAHRFNEFSKQYPDIQLEIHEIEERDFVHKFPFRDYDIYILRGEVDALADFHITKLYEDTLVAVMSKHHSLASYPLLHISQLKNQALLLPPSYTTITKTAIQACQQYGFSPQVVRYSRTENILSAARENEGIAMIMKKSLPVFQLSQVHIAYFQEDIHADIQLYSSTEHQKKHIIQTFLHFIKSSTSK